MAKVVVVGGHSRNIGKTSVMAGLIRDLKNFDWTAVKITQYGHGICSQDGNPCECAPDEHPFELTEETDLHGRGDTCRFLAWGARRSLWLRVRQGQLPSAFPVLRDALECDKFVMIESNSILSVLRPDLYLFVLEITRRDFKASARAFLNCADALVPVGSRFDRMAWPGLDPQLWGSKPLFPVHPRDFSSPELSDFVRRKIAPGNR